MIYSISLWIYILLWICEILDSCIFFTSRSRSQILHRSGSDSFMMEVRWLLLVGESGHGLHIQWSFQEPQMELLYHIRPYGYGSIPIDTIFRGMNIHLPAILMWTEGVQGFDTLPYFVGIVPSCNSTSLWKLDKFAEDLHVKTYRNLGCSITMHNTLW